MLTLAVAAAANADVTILASQIVLIDVVTQGGMPLPESAAAARALGPGTIVGVFPTGSDPQTNSARGFSVVNPVTGPARALPLTWTNSQGQNLTLDWLEPYDVNSTGLIVGQASAMNVTERFAFRKPSVEARAVPLAPGLDDASVWAESKATAVNNSNTVVGWKQPKGGGNRQQAFYWTETEGLKDIVIENAKHSRALSISDTGLVAGYYEPQTGSANQRIGFLYNIATGALQDLGPVVAPTSQWIKEFPSVSTNDAGAVAATREVGSGNDKTSQAFLLEGTNLIPIAPPSGSFEESFAAGISDTGWVVGILRDKQQAEADSGFLWFGGQTFDLSELSLPAGWSGITAAYGVYSENTGDPLIQIGTIVGQGTYLANGSTLPQQRAFAMQITLQVPEPHTYLMLGLGLLAIGALRMRRPSTR